MSYHKQLYPPPPRMCQSETEIRNLFERHMKALVDQKSKMINEIIEWGNNVIRQIQETVNKQKLSVEQEYKNQSHYIQIKCQEFLDTALIYEKQKDREEVRQLIEQCHTLKFQLGSFNYPEQSIPFIQIQKEEKQTKEIKQDSSNIYKVEKNPIVNDNFQIEDNKNIYATSTSRKLSSENSNQINQQLTTTSSFTNHDRLITTNDNFNNNDDMFEKCPACFMIFPLNMGTYERSKHVNQHFGDN